MHHLSVRSLAIYFATMGLAVSLVSLALSALAGKAHAGSLSWEVEGGVGGAMTDNQLSSSGSKLDLSQTGVMGSIGTALMLSGNSTMGGVYGRYSVMHEAGDVGSFSLKSTYTAEVGARLGIRTTAKTSVYGVAGWQWKDLDLSALGMGTKVPNGPLLGGGIEHQIGNTPFFVGMEYDHTWLRAVDLGSTTKFTPDENRVLAVLRYRFGTQKAPDVFDTSKLPPASEGCDPKLGNCHTPLK